MFTMTSFRAKIDDSVEEKSDDERLLQISFTPTGKGILTYLQRWEVVSTVRGCSVLGDRKGITAGSKIMLLNTFTGGHRREPAVQLLNVHLENMQHVNFYERDRLDVIANLPEKKKQPLPNGLLGDDKEWDIALQESTVLATLNEIRILFA
ncbi:hypothetical protein Tco_0173396 [Tanacetum coccineum]